MTHSQHFENEPKKSLGDIPSKASFDFNMDYLSEPWEHQKVGLKNSIGKDFYGFFYEAGTGKTLTTILASRAKMAMAKRKLKVLVVCPVIVIENWAKEWLNFSRLKPVTLVGSSAKVRKTLAAHPEADVLIINYEKLLGDMKDEGTVVFDLLKRQCDILIIDESHKVKDVRAKRSKAVFALAKVARYRFALSGTPILNSPQDIFGQIKCLDLGKKFGTNPFDFKRRYFFDRNANMPAARYFPDWKLKPGALEEISAAISPFSMHVKKSECLDLPPFIRDTIAVEMTPKQRKMYNELKADFVSYIDDKACVANLAMVKALRLLQIASGFCVLEDLDGKNREEMVFEPNPKAQALKELLETTCQSSKVLVWCAFRRNYADVAKVCKRLGVGYVEIHGDIKSKDKFESVDKLNNDPDTRVLIGHPGSGGIGINLVAASYSVFYSRSFSLEHDLQAEARNYRGGSEIHEKITRIDLVAKDSIDELVLKKLAEKENIGHAVLKDLARSL